MLEGDIATLSSGHKTWSPYTDLDHMPYKRKQIDRSIEGRGRVRTGNIKGILDYIRKETGTCNVV